MVLDRLVHAAEYLDAPAHDPAVLEASLAQVAAVNRWLGGTRALLRELARLLPAGGTWTILDIGTGSGEEPRAILRWARRRQRRVRITALDRHRQVLSIAARRAAAHAELRVLGGDARALPFPDDSFHVAFLSLTLHHFSPEDQLAVLREMSRVARRAILVSDLERCWPNYLGARLLARTWWRHNPLTRHDGPLSVLRGFTRGELRELAHQVGLPAARVRRYFFYRLMLVGGTVQADPAVHTVW